MGEHGQLQEAITKSLEMWSIISFYDLALLLLFIGTLLHFAGGYYRESLKHYRIKVSKENWSILFFLIRDFSLFGSFGISLLLLNPDMFADVKMAMPFFPIGTILLGIALVFKAKGNVEAESPDRKLFNIFLIFAAVVQYLGFILVMEGAPKEWVEQGVAGEFWLHLRNLRSNLNPALSMWSFYVSFPILLIILGLILKFGFSTQNIENEDTDQFKPNQDKD